MFASALASLALLAASVQAAPISSEVTLAKIAASLALPTTNQTNAVEWYAQNGNAGACGVYSNDTDLVVGLPTEFYYDLDSVSTYCGAYVVIKKVFVLFSNAITGQNVTARVEDASAANETLSVSIATWDALKGDETNLKEVTWVFANATEIAAAKESASSSSAAPSTSSAARTSTTQAQEYKPSSTKASSTTYYQPKTTTTTTTTTSYKPTTTTKAYVAPSSSAKAYTTSYKPKTTTTTTTTQAAATTAKKASSYSSSSSSSSSSDYTGYATFYTQGGVAGACGTVHSDSDYIIALETSMYDGGAHCGDKVSISYNGKTVTATVADECPSCVSSTSIDLSVAAFTSLASEDVGMMSVQWSWA